MAEGITTLLQNGKYSEKVINFFGLRLQETRMDSPTHITITPGVLADNNRLGSTTTIIDNFSKLMQSHRGEVPCVVTSAEASVDSKVVACSF